jgi:hypothetical protein
MYFSPSAWNGLSMVLEVENVRENSFEPPVLLLLVELEHPVRARAATVGMARAPAANRGKRRCCVIVSLSDFFV